MDSPRNPCLRLSPIFLGAAGRFEHISLLKDYENLSALPDSFCVVVENDVDDANFFAIGMDNSQGGHSYFVQESNESWQPMRQNSVEGTTLDGWNAMIRANQVVPQKQITAI